MDATMIPLFKEACWPVQMIWVRILHAYTSDSPPMDWGVQKGSFGIQFWAFGSHNEKYSVAWDTIHSYWKVNTPFGDCLFFIGPLFLNKTRKGLAIPPLFNVHKSDTDILRPASGSEVIRQMKKIAKYVVKP